MILGMPFHAANAPRWPRRKFSMRASRKKRRKMWREKLSTMTNTPSRSDAPAYRYVTKMGPVTLGLLPGQRAQAQIGLRFRTWPMAGDDGAETTWPSAIAAFPRHRVQAAGGQRRELGQHLADERQIGVDLQWPLRRPDAWQAGLGQYPGDGFGVHAQLPGDRSDAPLFDVVIAQDLRLKIRRNSHDRVLFVCSDGPGAAGSLAEHVPNSDDHNTCSTIPACVEAVGCPWTIAL